MSRPTDSDIDDFVGRVYALGGAVSTAINDEYRICIISLPGILTKFEPLEAAIIRLDEWEASHAAKSPPPTKRENKMKLLCFATGKEVSPGDKLMACSGAIEGIEFEVVEIQPPGQQSVGLIRVTTPETQDAEEFSLVPRVLDCIFIQDDSLVTSVSYDNEKSVGDTIIDIVTTMRREGRDVRLLLIGDKEWDKIRDLEESLSHQTYTSAGTMPTPKFFGVEIFRVQQRPTCLAFEHGPISAAFDSMEEAAQSAKDKGASEKEFLSSVHRSMRNMMAPGLSDDVVWAKLQEATDKLAEIWRKLK